MGYWGQQHERTGSRRNECLSFCNYSIKASDDNESDGARAVQPGNFGGGKIGGCAKGIDKKLLSRRRPLLNAARVSNQSLREAIEEQKKEQLGDDPYYFDWDGSLQLNPYLQHSEC